MASITELLDSSTTAQLTVSAILGGMGFKIIEHFLNGKAFVSEHTSLRAELREELDSVKKDVLVLRAEVNEWREKYFAQLNITNELKNKLGHLQNELDDYKLKIDNTFNLMNTDMDGDIKN